MVVMKHNLPECSVGRRAHVGTHISGTGAHSHLVRTGSGINYYFFYFLKARRAVMGPAKRGPIWAG